jgi:long-chain acyl-CoA synthetase
MANLASHSVRRSAERPDAIALRTGEQTITYQQLDLLRSARARQLHDRGCRLGDRVALLLPNGIDFVITYLAALHLGAVPVLVGTRLRPAEVADLLDDCTPVLVVTNRSMAARVGGERSDPPTVILVEDLPLTSDAAPPAMADLGLEAPAVILYTSGTTGRPKGAVLSHGNVISNIAAKIHYTGMTVIDRALIFLPLYHCYGLNAVLNPVLEAGASAVLLAEFDLRSCLAAIRNHDVTMFFAVPSIYRLLLDTVADPEVFSGIRYFMSAGAPLPEQTWTEWRSRFGSEIHQAYGLTETSPFACYDHAPDHRPGSVGTPIRGVEIRIVDTAGRPREVGQEGEILVRGPNVMLGYWGRPEETARAVVDGWFHTGDVGYSDEDGYLHLIDRLTDMIIVNGHNVYPAEVERILLEHPDVREAVVYGVAHRVLGEIVCASIVTGNGENIPDALLRSYCTNRLASFKVPKHFTVTAEIPRNPTGKPMRKYLAEQLSARL